MKASYAAAEVFADVELDAYRRAVALVGAIPHALHAGEWIRCHEVARAVSLFLPMCFLADGKFGPADHSWLQVPRGPGDARPAILDVYAVGRLPMVQLVDTRSWVLRTTVDLYREGPLRGDIRRDVVAYLVGRMKEVP